MVTQTDSFPRIAARDVFMVLSEFNRRAETKLENIRLRLCVDRKKPLRGTSQWSVARDNAGELVKLGFVEGSCLAKNTSQYHTMKDNSLRVTPEGKELLRVFREDRGKAYDRLFERMVQQHPYLRQFITVINKGNLFAPVISSSQNHLSPRYTGNAILAEDVANGSFDYDGFLTCISERIGRPLTDAEHGEISDATEQFITECRPSAVSDESAKFAKNFINKMNYIVIPALFRNDGLGFDYRTHRAIWAMGQDFRVWATLASHPDFDGSLVYLTADLQLDHADSKVGYLEFNHGLRQTGDHFLRKLYAAYQRVQAVKRVTFVPAWELRSVFCLDNQCQPTVFNRLFDDSYNGSDEYRLDLEIQRQKPQHEAVLRAGNRNIGSVRVAKR
jgi:hypothetical protein